MMHQWCTNNDAPMMHQRCWCWIAVNDAPTDPDQLNTVSTTSAGVLLINLVKMSPCMSGYSKLNYISW